VQKKVNNFQTWSIAIAYQTSGSAKRNNKPAVIGDGKASSSTAYFGAKAIVTGDRLLVVRSCRGSRAGAVPTYCHKR
jgi:hypothetical protein